MKKGLVKFFSFCLLIGMFLFSGISLAWASTPEFESPYYYVFDLFLRTLNLPVRSGAVVQWADSFEGYLKSINNTSMLDKLEEYKTLSWGDTIPDINSLFESLNDWISLSSCEHVGNEDDPLQTFSIDLPSFPDPLPSSIGMEGIHPTPFSDVNIPSDIDGYVYLYSDSYLSKKNGRDVCVRRNIYAPDVEEVFASYTTHSSNLTSLRFNFGLVKLKSISTIYYMDDYSIAQKDTSFSDSFSDTSNAGAYYHFCSLMNLPFYTFSSSYSLYDYVYFGILKHIFTDSKVTLWGMGKYKNDFSLDIDSMYLYELTLPSGYSSLSEIKYSDSDSFLSALQDAGLDIVDKGSYTLEIYKEDTEGNFVKEKTENLVGGIGRTPYIPKMYLGYSLREDLITPENGVVLEDGSLVVKAYYSRAHYFTEHYKRAEDGVSWIKEETENLSALFGEEASFTPKSYSGFTYKEDLTEPENKTLLKGTDLTIKLFYERNNYAYRVQHYKQGESEESYVKEEEENLTGLFGTQASFTPKDYPGFTYKGNLTDPENKKIPANDSLTIKLYYSRNKYNYVVEHYQQTLDGGYTKIGADSLSGLYGNPASFVQKSFEGFTCNPPSASIPAADNLIVKVYYNRIPCSYTVEHYKQDETGKKWVKEEEESFSLLYGATASFTEKEYPGFSFSDSLTTPENKILNDSSMIVKLYYPRNTYTYVVEHYQGIVKPGITEIDYVLADKEELTGLFGAKIAITPKEYKGFTYLNNEKSLTVPDNDDLLIKCYYTKGYEQSLFEDMFNVDKVPSTVAILATGFVSTSLAGLYLTKLMKRTMKGVGLIGGKGALSKRSSLVKPARRTRKK